MRFCRNAERAREYRLFGQLLQPIVDVPKKGQLKIRIYQAADRLLKGCPDKYLALLQVPLVFLPFSLAYPYMSTA